MTGVQTCALPICLVVRNEDQRAHVYEAARPREWTQRQLATDMLQRAFNGSAKSLLIGALLQSSTSLRLDVDGPWARWTYDISASTEVGRQKHDILALGYMLDLLRRFAGPRWTPPRVEVIGPPIMGRAAVQDVLSCELSRGDVSAVIFPSELLELPSLRPALPDDPGSSKSRRPYPTHATS